MKKAVFFDMNETLLNLNLLKECFDKYFEDSYVLPYWFTKLLHTSTVTGIMDGYKNFGELAGVVLENIFYESGKHLSAKVKDEILSAFKNLPAYDDVPEALRILKDHNIRVIAVSNSSLHMIKEQLENAGIIGLLDAYYSVDAVKKYKPFEDVYVYVAQQEDLNIKDAVMVATHDWDLYGAKKAGLTTAYIKRKEQIFNPYYLQPDISNDNLVDLVQEILSIGT